MNAEHPNGEQLQRGYDGDLSNQEAAELQRHLATCAQCQAEVDSIGRMGQLVRWAVRAEPSVSLAPQGAAPIAPVIAEGGLPDFDRMFAEIERATRVPDAAAAELVPNNVSPLRRDEVRVRVADRRTPRWLHRAAPALGAVALAAAALLMVVRQESVPSDANLQPTNETEAVAAVGPGRTEVEEAYFGSNGGQVFDIPMTDGAPIPVIWIDDDDDDEE